MSNTPLHDVIAQNNSIRRELDNAIAEVVDLGNFINGRAVNQFEESFAAYLGGTICVGVGNATDGFEVAFQALELDLDSEVIVPANAHISPVLAALNVGLKPVCCDVDEERLLMNANTVKEQITPKTKAVVVVHLYGWVCPMKELQELCDEYGLFLIEDFSQAQGATYQGRKVGSLGDVSVCSFYPTKPLGALGDGGAIITSNAALAERCRSLANYGWKERDNTSMKGGNSRLDELQAAVLNVKLRYLDEWNSERLVRANGLQNKLSKIDGVSVTELQEGDVCHLLVIQSEKRDELQQFLLANGIDAQVHYPIPIHKQQLLDTGLGIPVSEKLCNAVLSVPVDHSVARHLGKFARTVS